MKNKLLQGSRDPEDLFRTVKYSVVMWVLRKVPFLGLKE